MKRNFLKASLAGIAFAIVGFTPLANAQGKGTIGISMPTKSSARWIDDGNNMVKVLKERGYKTDLQYADDDIPNQLAQVENMITKGAKVLVIAAIDGTTLSTRCRRRPTRASRSSPTTADPRLEERRLLRHLRQLPGRRAAGQLHRRQAGPEEGKGPFNIELFGGSPDDNNAFFFYDGAMSVLKPYIDSGKLVVRSKQMGMDKVGTLRWDGAVAQARMDNLLSAFYGKDKVDAVLSPYDGLSIGILSSLKGVGYCSPASPARW
jgi:putative multiple sugar transport system substrate-binding protein